MLSTMEYTTWELGDKEWICSAPVGVSNRHIHLCSEDIDALFGDKHQLTTLKPLTQCGEFAAQETVTIVGSRGVIECVRVLGPVRNQTQVEISMTDGYRLGIRPPVRDSGDLEGTPGVVVVGNKGAINLRKGVILAARHVHMNTGEAARWQLTNGDRVRLRVAGIRAQIMENVLVRVKENYHLEVHLDIDEANGALLKSGDQIHLLH